MVLLYAVELGFFFCVAILQFKRDLLRGTTLAQERLAAWVMLATTLLVVSLLQSDASGNNDLGFRGMLLAQFILLLWAAPLVHDLFAKENSKEANPGPVWKTILVLTLVIGALGTMYQLALLRSYAPLADAAIIQRSENFLGVSPGIGRRTYLLRYGLSAVDKLTAPSSVLQYNPVGRKKLFLHLYSTHQAAAGDDTCGSTFGGNIDKCRQAMPYIVAAFNYPAGIRGWDLNRFCDSFSVNLLAATDADPVWQDPASWVWSRRPLVSNDAIRIIPCGTSSSQSGPH
jgi:hypothetical protein